MDVHVKYILDVDCVVFTFFFFLFALLCVVRQSNICTHGLYLGVYLITATIFFFLCDTPFSLFLNLYYIFIISCACYTVVPSQLRQYVAFRAELWALPILYLQH